MVAKSVENIAAARKARRTKEHSVYDALQSANDVFGLPDDDAGFLSWKLEDEEDVFTAVPTAHGNNALVPATKPRRRNGSNEADNPLLRPEFDEESAMRVIDGTRDASADDVSQWLAAIGLADYAVLFLEHDIDGSSILDLTQSQIFSEIGVNDMEDLATLWAVIEELRDTVQASDAEQYAEAQSSASVNTANTMGLVSMTNGERTAASVLPMKNLAAGHALAAGLSIKAAEVAGVRNVTELNEVVRRKMQKGFCPGSTGASHIETVDSALALLRDWHAERSDESRRHTPSRFHLTLLKMCDEDGLSGRSALTVFKDLSDSCLTKSQEAYQHVLNVLVRTGASNHEDLDVAAKVIYKMEEEQFEVTAAQYDPVVSAFAARSHIDRALELIAHATYDSPNVDTPLSLVAFTAVLRACAEASEGEQVLQSSMLALPCSMLALSLCEGPAAC